MAHAHLAPSEPLLRAWARRLLTVPGLLAITAAYLALLPPLLLAALVRDLLRRGVAPRRCVALRFALAVALALIAHVIGLAALFGTWVLGARWAGAAPERQARLDMRAAVWWSRWVFRALGPLYGLRLSINAGRDSALAGPSINAGRDSALAGPSIDAGRDSALAGPSIDAGRDSALAGPSIDGAEALDRGPLLLLCRHASLLDTLLPFALMSGRGAGDPLRLRYVMKRELRWDPVIDIIGHRLPTAFVARGTPDHARQIALVEHLLDGLGPGDAVVIFPEGTRYSPAKRARVLASLAAKDPEAHARALRLRHVLPPHPGGPLGLLEHNPGADVVILAHTGLEGANHLADLISGSLLDAEVRVKLWRVPAAEIPRGREASLRWLHEWWERVDEWLEGQGSR